MNKYLILITGIIFQVAFLVPNSHAQTEDFQSWQNVSVKKALNKKVNLMFEQELRLENNAGNFKDYITVFGGHYSINKYVKTRAYYRHTYSNNPEDGQLNEHRWYADLILRYKYERIIFGYRARYQFKYEDFNVSRLHHLRNRLSVKYDIPKSKIVPYAQCELYYSLNNPVQNSIDKSRYTVGLSYSVLKYLNVSAFYRMQYRREPSKKPTNNYILGVGLEFDL